MKKVQKNFQEKAKEYNNSNKNEGDISVDYPQDKHSESNYKDGEYIDFEEIDE